MTRTTTTITLSIAAGIIAAIAMYGAFTAGILIGALQLPQFDGKTTTDTASVLRVDTGATSNANQAYDNSSYYLQPTVSPAGYYSWK